MYSVCICIVSHTFAQQLGQIQKLGVLTLPKSAVGNVTVAQLHLGFSMRCCIPHDMLYPVPFSSV